MGPLLLFITTFIWGTAFLAQKLGGETLGPFAVTALRNVLGGVFLLALVGLRRVRPVASAMASVRAGVACGVPLFAAMLAQQIGIQYTTPGISAFLTTNYVLFVPLLAALLTRKFPGPYVTFGVMLALGGTYLICMPGSEGLSVGRGELWTILCAFLFAVQMLVVDHFARKSDVLVLSATQLFTAAALGAPFLMVPSESARIAELFANPASMLTPVLSLVYLGVFSSGIAYTLQNFGQARTPPALAAILLSMESVFGALSGYLVLGDRMTTAQFVGCALVFLAAAGSQLLALREEKLSPTEKS